MADALACLATGKGERVVAGSTVERDYVVRTAASLMLDAGSDVDGRLVAAAAGVDYAVLRRWFPAQADLVRGVTSWYADLLCPPPSLFATLADVGSWAEEQVMYAQMRCLTSSYGFALLVGQRVDDQPKMRDAIGEVFRRWASAIEKGLHTIQRRGELRKDADLAALAGLLLSSLQGGLLLTRVYGDTERLEIAMRGALATVASMAICGDAGIASPKTSRMDGRERTSGVRPSGNVCGPSSTTTESPADGRHDSSVPAAFRLRRWTAT